MVNIIIIYYVVMSVGILVLALLSWLIWDKRFRNRHGQNIPNGFIRTDEVMVDPTTNKKLRVYYSHHTGERFYKEEKWTLFLLYITTLSGKHNEEKPLSHERFVEFSLYRLCSFLYILDMIAFPLEVIEATMYKKCIFYMFLQKNIVHKVKNVLLYVCTCIL